MSGSSRPAPPCPREPSMGLPGVGGGRFVRLPHHCIVCTASLGVTVATPPRNSHSGSGDRRGSSGGAGGSGRSGGGRSDSAGGRSGFSAGALELWRRIGRAPVRRRPLGAWCRASVGWCRRLAVRRCPAALGVLGLVVLGGLVGRARRFWRRAVVRWCTGDRPAVGTDRGRVDRVADRGTGGPGIVDDNRRGYAGARGNDKAERDPFRGQLSGRERAG